MSEVGAPVDGLTDIDWVIETGDIVVRENEALKMYGDIIIQPGGNLTLLNCDIQFFYPVSGNYLLHVQKNESLEKYGELFMEGTSISVLNESGGYYYDFIIEGNASIDGCDIAYVGSESSYGGIQVYSDNVSIMNSKIHDNEKYGIYTDSNPIIMNNEIYSNEYGVYFEDSTTQGAMIRDNLGENRFGSFINCMWDFNNDTISDVIISAPYDDTKASDAGAVYLFYGRDGLTLSELNPFDANIKLFGESSNDLFGKKIDFSGDLNGDGLNDLIIAAPGADKVYVYFANASGYGGVVINETSSQFNSGNLTNMEVISGGSFGQGQLALVGTEHYVNWNLEESVNRSQTSDINFWSDGVSISFPDDMQEYALSTINENMTGYFTFDQTINETLGYNETGINYTSQFYYDQTPDFASYTDGTLNESIRFDGVNTTLRINASQAPFSDGNGTIQFNMNAYDDSSDERSLLSTEYRKMVFGKYDTNLTRPEFGIVVQENNIHIETYDMCGDYEQQAVEDGFTITDTSYSNSISGFESLSSYSGVVPGPQDITPMMGSQGGIFNSASFAIQADQNSWVELVLSSSYHLNSSAQLSFNARCDGLGEIHAIGLANGTSSTRNELLYRMAGTAGWGTTEMASGTWINNGGMIPNAVWSSYSLNAYTDWTNNVNSQDTQFDRIIIVMDNDAANGIWFLDDIQISNIYTKTQNYNYQDFFNGSIITDRILTSDMYLQPNHDYNIKFYEKNHYAYLEIDGEVHDIQRLNEEVEDKIDFDNSTDFYSLAQRPLKNLDVSNPTTYTYNSSDSHTTFSSFSGWIDELKFYNIPVEVTSIDPRDGGFYPLKPDVYTELLVHFEGSNDDIINDFYYDIYNFTLEGKYLSSTTDGYLGKGALFNGNSYIKCGDRYNLTKGTYETYFTLTNNFSSSSSSDMYLVYKDGFEDGFMKLYFNESTGKLSFSIKDMSSTYQISSSSTFWGKNRWYHVAVSWGDGMKMYLDGILQEETSTFSGYLGEDNSNLIIGSNFETYQYVNKFQGKMDEIRLSNNIRTDFPDLEYFWKERESIDDGSIFMSHFNEGSGSATVDEMNENDASVSEYVNWIDGKFGKGLSFGGNSTSKISFSTSGGIYALDNDISIQAWVKPSDFDNTWNYILQRQNSYALAFYKDTTTSKVYLRGMVYQGGAAQWTSTSNNVFTFHDSTDQWYHVGLAYDTTSGYLKTYVNGRMNSILGIGSTNNIPESGSSIEIGEYFTGIIDDANIHSIRKDHFNSSEVYSGDTIYNFNFDEGEGLSTDDPEYSSFKAVLYNGEEYGGTWVSGVSGYGVSLDGSDDYVLINDTNFNYNQNEFTLNLDLKIPQTLNGNRYVILEKDNSFNISIVEQSSEYLLQVSARSNQTWYSTSFPDEAVDLNDLIGHWIKVSFTFSEGEIDCFLNGRYYSRVSIPFISISNSSKMYVGRNEDGNYLKGIIDNLHMSGINVANNIRYTAEVISSVKSFDSPVRITSIDIPCTIDSDCAVKYQIRYGNTSTEASSSSFEGPSGPGSYYFEGDLEYGQTQIIAKYVQLRIIIQSDRYDVSPIIRSVNITGIGYHQGGTYSSPICELPDWVDRVSAQIMVDSNGRSISYSLGCSNDNEDWYNVSIADGTVVEFNSISTKYVRLYVSVAGHDGTNGAYSPYIDSIRIWYEFEKSIGSFNLSGSSLFGESISSGGDFNGDGYSDIAIGSPSEKKVYIYHGGGSMDSVVDCTVTSSYTGFGMNISFISDYNGDGKDELAVVSTSQSDIFIYSGDDLSGSVSDSESMDMITGSGAFGTSVKMLGDIDNDKFVEIGVFSSNQYYYVYSTRSLYEDEDISSSEYLFRIDGGAGSVIGQDAQGQFDFNGDTFFDLMVTDQSNDKVYVFNGSREISGNLSVSDAIYRFEGDGSSTTFGESSSAGDVNGDGFVDFLVGEWSNSTYEGDGIVHCMGPANGRVSGNSIFDNDYGVYMKDSQISLSGDHLFDNGYGVYSEDSTITLIGIQINNETSKHDHSSLKGLYVSGGFVSAYSSEIYTYDNVGVTNYGGSVSLYNVTIDQSQSQYVIDYSLDDLAGSYENITVDGGSVQLLETGSSEIFVENFSSIDDTKWNKTGSGDAVVSNNTWSGSGNDMKLSCSGDEISNENLNMSYTIEFDSPSSSIDYQFSSRFVVMGTKANHTSGSFARVTLTFKKDLGSTQVRNLVVSSYDEDLVTDDPFVDKWLNYGDCWVKNTSSSGVENYYIVANESYYEIAFTGESLVDIICNYFDENPENWLEVDNLTVKFELKEMTTANNSGMDYDPVVYCDEIEVIDSEYVPVYYSSGYLVSDVISRPTNNEWNELFVTYQDPSDINKLKIYLLDSNDTVLTQISSVPFDLSSYGYYSQLKFKAYFDGNSLSSSRLTKWGVSFTNTNDTAIFSNDGEVVVRDCSISNVNSNDMKIENGCYAALIDTETVDGKLSVSGTGSSLSRYSRIDVDTYPEIHPYMDEGFHHEKSGFVEFFILDRDDDQVFSGFTNRTGTLEGILLLESYWTSSEIEFMGPFKFRTYGHAIEFDGSDDKISLNRYFNSSIQEFTACAWFNTDFSGSASNDNIALLDYDESEYFSLYVRGDNGKIGFSTYSTNNGVDNLYGSTACNDGEWHYVCVVYDGYNKTIYLDGVEDGRSVNAHNGADVGGSTVRYGFIGDGSEATTFNGTSNGVYYLGYVDDVALYMRDLSMDEIYRYGNRSMPSNPDQYYSFEDRNWTSGSYDVKDCSGNGYHGMRVNGPEFADMEDIDFTQGYFNNVSFSIADTKKLWIKSDSIDSDDDFILDSQENMENVLWYEGEDFTLDESRVDGSWESCGELSLKPDSDGLFIDRYFPLPVHDDDYIRVGFRAGPGSQVSGYSVKLNVWEVDGYTSSLLVEDHTYQLSSRFRYYMTDILQIDNSTNNLKIKISSDDDVLLDSLLIIRSEDDLGGQITNPIFMDSDKDLIIDGVEQRSGTHWFETEYYGDGAILNTSASSNGQAIYNVSGSEISSIPVYLENGTEYRYYFRGRSVQESEWETFDDFADRYESSDKWEYISEFNEEAGFTSHDPSDSNTLYQYIHMGSSTTDVGREIKYTLREFRTNSTFRIEYNLSSNISLGKDARMILGVIDGNDSTLRAEFAFGFSETENTLAPFDPLDFNTSTILLISDGKDLGFYKKNKYGAYSLIGNASVESFTSFRLFLGVSAANIDSASANQGIMSLNINKVEIKEENLRMSVVDSSQSLVMEKEFSLDDQFRWNYINFTAPSTGTFYLKSYANADISILGDKAMVCNMSQIKQTYFNIGGENVDSFSIGEGDYSSDGNGNYQYTFNTSYLPGSSFVTSGIMRVRSNDLEFRTPEEVNWSDNIGAPSIHGQYIAWTEIPLDETYSQIYIKDIQGSKYGPYGISNTNLTNASIYGNYIVVEAHPSGSSTVTLKLLEINTTISSGSGYFRPISIDLDVQRNPHIYLDRIVFEGYDLGDDVDIYVYDLDIDDDSLYNFFEDGYGIDDDSDNATDEDPFDFLDNDGDGEIDEDRNYSGLYHLELIDNYFLNESWDQILPRICGDRIVFKDMKSGQDSVWMASLVTVEPSKGQLTEACLKVNSTILIDQNSNGYEYENLRISGDVVLYKTKVGYNINYYQTEYRPSVVIFDIPHQSFRVLQLNVSSFDVYNENLVYSTSEYQMGCYDINEQVNNLLEIENLNSYPAIHGNNFAWIQESGEGFRISYHSQYFTVSSMYSSNTYLKTSKVIPVDRLTNDFGPDILNHLYGNTMDSKYSFTINATTELSLTIDHLNINLEFIMDPCDPDTDYDDITDGEEVVIFGGIDILECEDSQLYRPWSPIGSGTEYIAVDDEATKLVAGYGFFQPRSVSLISSQQNGSTSESWIKMEYVAPKTGTYRFSLNYPDEDRKEKLVGTMIPGNLPKTELLPNGSATVEDIELNSSTAGYYQDILGEAFSMKLKYAYSEVDPIQYGSASTYDYHVNLIKAVNYSSNPNSTAKQLAIGEITAEAQYHLEEGMTYHLVLELDMVDITTSSPTGVDQPDRISLQYLDYVRVDYQGLDPMSRDSDNDGIMDGDEAFNSTRYALSSDPDRDGINDRYEFEFGTNFGDRDSDGDGLRDGVELGLTEQFIEWNNGIAASGGSYFERIAHSPDHSPFNFTPISNYDGDNGNTTTDPMDVDTDDDGIPDGWIDGWYYGEEVFPRLYRSSSGDDFWSRYDNLDYWEYQVDLWGRKMDPDNIVQMYEGEDMNLNGKVEPAWGIWSFDPYTFEFCGMGETDTNSKDTDSDGIEDGYEVWYSHLWPYFIYRNGSVEGLDPTRDDSWKDIDGVDVLWDVGVMEGEEDIVNNDDQYDDDTLDDDENYHRWATNDADFADMLNGEPELFQGFAQRLELRAGDLQDADYLEVKAEFMRPVYVEIWEGRDDDFSSPSDHYVAPERKVFSIQMPPTHSESGWIKIPLTGDFNFSETVSGVAGTSTPVYFLVIRNSEQYQVNETGFIWYAKEGDGDSFSTLVYCDSVFNTSGISPEEYQMQMEEMLLGGVPGDFVENFFNCTWDHEFPGTSIPPGLQVYDMTFGYRVIDLDKEALVQDVGNGDGELVAETVTLGGIDHSLAIRLTNFTSDERESFSNFRFFIERNAPWRGNFSIYFSGRPDCPEAIMSSEIEMILSPGRGWVDVPINDGSFFGDDKGYFWILIESSSSEPISFYQSECPVSGLIYKQKQGPTAQWNDIDQDFNPAFMIFSDKFDSEDYGDGLSNLHEYIIGTHPKKENTDYMEIGDDTYDDGINDGAEIFAGGTSSNHNKGGVIYRTEFENGSRYFDSYQSGYVYYDGDGYGSNLSRSKYEISRVLTNPPSEMEMCDEDSLVKLFRLKDGSGVFKNYDGSHLYIWKETEVIPDSSTSASGQKYCAGSVVILNSTSSGGSFNYNPTNRNKEIYFSNPFEIDTDQDGIVDGEEVNMYEDTDGDSVSNLRDTDSDNDTVLDRQEINWNGDNDTDGKKNMVDDDSDGDGLLDGWETSWNFDTDGDGHENMVDPDSDGDGLADGWIDGMIWDWKNNSFVDLDDYEIANSNYCFPNEKWGVFDPWEGEDTNLNGVHDRDEPDMTKKDTDGDGLWDGFDVYADDVSNSTRNATTPLHYGELYFIANQGNENDNGMPYSGGNQYRYAQLKVKPGEYIQMTSQVSADSDGDGLTDFEEILCWYVLVEDFVPAYETDPWVTVESDFALNLVGTNDINSDPNIADSDGDGLTDKEEYLYTNPLDKDSDNDGLSDYQENPNKNKLKDRSETNPLDRDTDNDGLPDGWADGWDNGENDAWDHIRYGEMECNSPSTWYSFGYACEFGEYMKNSDSGEMEWISNPLEKDTDFDCIPDGTEMCYYWNVKNDPFMDSDDDGDSDLFEKDSDNDGLLDSEENINRDFYMNGWWAVYTDATSKPSNGIWIVENEEYKIFHYNETDPTDPDCDDDGLWDSVEPDPLMDTDGDGYINAWDQDSNDAEGNGPGVGPKGWEGPEGEIYTPADSNGSTDNDDIYDHIDGLLWETDSDLNQTYIVFRTNAEDTDGDRKIDYDDLVNNSGKWISVDSLVNLQKNEDSSNSMSSDYELEHDWSDTAYIITSVVTSVVPTGTVMQVYYGEDETDNPENILTPEGYKLIKSGTNVYIQIEENLYVKCENATGSAPSSFTTEIHSNTTFVPNRQETIDGRPALNLDSDFDGIINPIEVAYGLNKNDADTDNDGLLDGEEFGWWNNSDGDAQFYSGFVNTGGYASINALDPDSDNDGILDGTEAGVTEVHAHSKDNINEGSGKPHYYPIFIGSKTSFDADNGKTTTDPLNPDSDGDGLLDGWNNTGRNGINSVGSSIWGEDFINNDYFGSTYDYADGKIDGDTDQNGIWSDSEIWKETSPNDMDSDDDGISDMDETFNNGSATLSWYADFDGDGRINAVDPDSDNDLLYDGLERGYKPGDIGVGTDLTRGYFVPDTDRITTDPFDLDSDDDNINDGIEDANHNGRIEGDNGDGIYGESETWTETSPNLKDTDGDTIEDYWEKQYGYNPLSTDTDLDGISDDLEDLNKDGLYDSSENSGETDPTEMDSDGDGLMDKQEIDGWIVVIIRESTGEQLDKYTVSSNPRIRNSDSDSLDDYSEYMNATNPTEIDTDGDGKNDDVEILEFDNCSAWGIDGVPPNITKIDKSYEERYGGYSGLKLIGVDVKLTISCKDDYGIQWIKVKLQGEGEKIIYFNNETEVKETFSFRSDNYARILWSGFDVNITAADRNENLGYKESEVKGVIKAKFDALLGALLSFVSVLVELISSICQWLYDLPEELLNSLITSIENAKEEIINGLTSLSESIRNSFSDFSSDINENIDNFLNSLCSDILFVLFGSVEVTITVIELIVSGASFGSASILGGVLAVLITVLIVLLMSSDEIQETVGNLFFNMWESIISFTHSIGIHEDDISYLYAGWQVLSGFLGKLILTPFGMDTTYHFIELEYMDEVCYFSDGAAYSVEETVTTVTSSKEKSSFAFDMSKLKNPAFLSSLGWSMVALVLSIISFSMFDTIKDDYSEDIVKFVFAWIIGFGSIVASFMSFYYSLKIPKPSTWVTTINNVFAGISIQFSWANLLYRLVVLGVDFGFLPSYLRCIADAF